MELEFKHLAAYLTCKLKCTRIKVNDNKFIKDFAIKELIGLSFNTNRECFVGIFQNSELDINQIVPFLHPLSDLTKEMREELNKIDSDYSLTANYQYFKKDGLYYEPIQMPYDYVQKLLEWHIDIFGLIDAGLAIDLNTIK